MGESAVNTDLFEHGIYTEKSDIRAHVSVVNRTVYVFQTRLCVEAIEQHGAPLRPAFQLGVDGRTAEGWLVQPEWIQDLRKLKFHSWSGWVNFNPQLSTSEKGELAVQCVIEIMRVGRFPLWLMDVSEDGRLEVQREGTDILLFLKRKVQVKCDYNAGETPLGTGNLFVQKAERNPLRRY